MIPLVARGIASLAVRLIARNPRLGKKIFDLLKRPKGITLYRGEPAKPIISLKDQAKHMYDSKTTVFDWTNPALRRAAAGRWFSESPTSALSYAGRGVYSLKPSHWRMIKEWGGGYEPGIIKKLTLTPKELKLAKRLQIKISGGDMARYYVIPRSTLPRVEKASVLTAITNLKNMMGLKEGGLAQILNV